MTSGVGRGASLFTLSFAVFLAGGGASAIQHPPPATAAGPTPSIALTATVRSVDAPGRTLEVVTGVGLALRVVRLAWKETTTVKAASAGAGMAQLKPGDFVHVEYAKTSEGNIVKTIDLLPRPGTQGAR
jgi:hypothetical protein